jgi:hypothetical protein
LLMGKFELGNEDPLELAAELHRAFSYLQPRRRSAPARQPHPRFGE